MKTSLKDLINTDLMFCKTPDLPSLRYSSGQPLVFLWDDLQDFTTLSSVLNVDDMPKHYESKFYSAITMHNYLPWYNLDSDANNYAAYCLDDVNDALWLDEADYVIGKPLPIKGKVVQLSLQALCLLDAHYLNGERFHRQTIKLYKTQFSKDTIECHAWFNSIDQIAVEAGVQYKLDDGIDVTPFTTKKFNKGEYYEM